MKNEKLIGKFEKIFKVNKLGHAYLFTNSFDEMSKNIEKIVNSFIFCKEESFKNNPDILIIRPEKNLIRKEQIIELENWLIKTSQTNLKKLYIINEAEKMNSSSYNSLLKTLEEPYENVFAFLFTKNLNSMPLTIKSRCQIVYAENNQETIDEDLIEESIIFIKKIEEDKLESIAYHSQYFYKKFEKADLKKLLNVVEYFYKDCLNKHYEIELEHFNNYEKEISEIANKNDEKKLIHKLLVLNKNMELLNYNINLNSFIDKLIIELGE